MLFLAPRNAAAAPDNEARGRGQEVGAGGQPDPQDGDRHDNVITFTTVVLTLS